MPGQDYASYVVDQQTHADAVLTDAARLRANAADRIHAGGRRGPATTPGTGPLQRRRPLRRRRGRSHRLGGPEHQHLVVGGHRHPTVELQARRLRRSDDGA